MQRLFFIGLRLSAIDHSKPLLEEYQRQWITLLLQISSAQTIANKNNYNQLSTILQIRPPLQCLVWRGHHQ